jgi:hypothetical protein
MDQGEGTLCSSTLYCSNFFFLNCFGWTKGPFFVFILLCHPSEDSLQWSTTQDGSPSKDRQSTVGWGDCQIRTRDRRFTVWCRYRWATNAPTIWATTAPAMSHQCSRKWAITAPANELPLLLQVFFSTFGYSTFRRTPPSLKTLCGSLTIFADNIYANSCKEVGRLQPWTARGGQYSHTLATLGWIHIERST